MPSVSILVAAYNAEATIDRCLDSLCQQTLADIQIICVDDCSTDGTLPLLHRRAAADDRILVLQTPVNSGQAVARNLALQHVEAPFVAMLDADDWFSPDALQSALDVFRQHPAADCVVFHLIQHYGDHDEVDFGLPQQLLDGQALDGRTALTLCLDHWRLHGLYMTRTTLHRQYPFDTATRLYSDDNTARLHYLHSREVRACNGRYYYRKHSASMTNAFSVRRFDFMGANLSLKFALDKEDLPTSLMRHFEEQRWMTFIGCYRLFLDNHDRLTPSEQADVRERLTTILHTFRPSRLPLRARWKPGYWLTLSPRLFHLQQRAYRAVKNTFVQKS